MRIELTIRETVAGGLEAAANFSDILLSFLVQRYLNGQYYSSFDSSKSPQSAVAKYRVHTYRVRRTFLDIRLRATLCMSCTPQPGRHKMPSFSMQASSGPWHVMSPHHHSPLPHNRNVTLHQSKSKGCSTKKLHVCPICIV